jgi:ceramide glucosyltransferase
MIIAATLIAFALLALHLASVALVLLRPLLRRPPDPAVGLPFIGLLRPVCGLDPFDLETLSSGFGLDYPSYEMIFCCAAADDPVIPLVRDLIAAHPGTPARLLIGDAAVTGNPKLNNLVKGWAATGADWIVMTDSNVLLPRDYLRQLLQAWSPGTGMVSSPPVGLRPDGLWGALECAFLNGHQARWQLAADALGMGFAQGKTLFTTRALVEGAGGLAALGRDLAEDVACTKMVRAAGLQVRLVAQPFAQPIGRRSLAAVWQRQVRWSRVRWHGFPWLFLLEPLSGPVVPLLALTAAAVWGGLPWGLVALFAGLWYGSELVLLRVMGWPCGLRDLAATLLRDLLLPVLWGATFAARGFVWRGTAMAPGQSGAAE